MKHLLTRLPFFLMITLTQTMLGKVADYKIYEGDIDGALFKVVRPNNATGDLLLLAHGFRPAELPLSATFELDSPLFAGLLAEGWTIGSTSYRRNGWIVEDAVKDLINLRQHISRTLQHPVRTFLLGGSMGGLIITTMAESHPEVFDGGVAMGAALVDEEGNWRVPLLFQPEAPLLFLTNQSETEGPVRYVNKSDDAPYPPVFWRVSRDGHVNLNNAEQIAALKALVRWSETGEIETNFDATIVPQAESTAKSGEGFAEGTVLRVHPIYGNFYSSFVPQDLEKLGIQKGDTFTISSKDREFSILMGSDFGDVEVGDWVAFWDSEGTLFIARNFKSASEALAVKAGDYLKISLPGKASE